MLPVMLLVGVSISGCEYVLILDDLYFISNIIPVTLHSKRECPLRPLLLVAIRPCQRVTIY